MTENNASIIKGLKPEKLWYYFGEISSIPRPSTKEGKVREWVIKFAKDKNLDYKTDEIGNIVIYKNSQNSKSDNTLIFQAHLDMVCESNPDVKIDFDKDPIVFIKEGDLLKAKGTTLGADNGIGVATMLAILDNKEISHPKIQAFFTIDEESGLTGAMNFDAKMLSGDYLINLDSEEEEKTYIGAAGGETLVSKYKIKWEKSAKLQFIKLTVDGLRGGHSGVDIHKNFGNGIKIVGHLLSELLMNNIDFNISIINGGRMKNAIPRNAEVVFGVEENNKSKAKELINQLSKKILDSYKESTEPNINIKIDEVEASNMVFDKEFSKKFVMIINTVHHGIFRISTAVKDLVETSNNLGVIKTENDSVEILSLSRSDDTLELDLAVQQILTSYGIIKNAEITRKERYPSWKPISVDKNPLLQKYIEVYSSVNGSKPEVLAIHAGLECGYFAEEMPDTLLMSIGPTIKNVHSPDEYISISSAERYWNVLLEFIKIL